MLFRSKRVPLIILGITAVAGARALFFFFNDPEGPNLLIVTVTAAVVYLVSLSIYLFKPSDDSKGFWLAVATQILVLSGLYFLGITF
jgi:hypothetical protein